MSESLEERREARRRRRMQQEENGVNCDQITADLEERLARRRREREERLKIIAAGVSAINGEDEFERRRRERREERLRQGDDPPSAGKRAEEGAGETTSTRRSRRRATEEDTTDTTETTSYRSRRRRGGDDEDSYSAPAPEPEPVVDEEALRRQQEQEEEEARQRAEAEELRRQQQEAERQRAAEAARLRAEEEERQRREEEDVIDDEYYSNTNERMRNNSDKNSDNDTGLYVDEENLHSDSQVKEMKTSVYETNLRKTSEIDTNIAPNNKDARKLTQPGKADKLKSFFEKQKDTDTVSDVYSNTTTSKKIIEDSSLKQVKEQLVKFESSMNLSESPKDLKREQRIQEVKLLAPGNDRLKDIQKKFQGDGAMLNGSSSRLGRFSASDMSINSSSQSPRSSGGRASVTGRWKSALDKKTEKENTIKSFRSSSTSLNENNNNEPLTKKSEKISQLSAKFKSVDESKRNGSLSPLSPKDGSSPVRRQWSLSSDASSEGGSTPTPKRRSQSSVTNRWQHEQTDSSANKTRPVSASTGDTTSRSFHDSRTLSLDRSDNLSKARSFKQQIEEEERLERERLEQEEREREEAIRLEQEKIEQEKLDAERAIREKQEREEEEEKRQLVERAARRMEEEKKKKKRKGLGGLSPEKKKMLKDDDVNDDDNSLEEKENLSWHEEEKRRILKERIGTLPDLDSMDREGLQRICKKLFAKLAELEEEVYDWEAKIKKQDFEINELTLKVNDTKGKFIKPVLRKVNKTESKLEKMHRKDKDKSDFRDTLKSTGQNKFSLEDEEKEDGKQDWRDNLKKSGDQEGEDVTEAVTLQAES